jgi:hypothetical protein
MGMTEGISLVKYVVNYSVYNFSFLVLFSFAFTSTYPFMIGTGSGEFSYSTIATVQRGVIKCAARDEAWREASCQANFQPDFQATC